MASAFNSSPPTPSQQGTTSASASRRASNQMSSPNMLNVLPSNQSAVAHPILSPPLDSSSSSIISGDGTSSFMDPGPLRHPRPLTAADLHMQLEKEQEAVVNRLTRELSQLRASQNASVASNASSTCVASAIPDTTDSHSNYPLSGASHPTPTRRHQRSGSSTSIRSIASTSVTDNNIAGVAPERPRNLHRHESNPMSPPYSMSRQNSVNSVKRSGASSPTPDHSVYGYSSRTTLPAQIFDRERSNSGVNAFSGSVEMSTERSMTSVPTTARYEEIAMHRYELETAKKENEHLKQRIRGLERMLKTRRESDASVRRPSLNRGRSGIAAAKPSEDRAMR